MDFASLSLSDDLPPSAQALTALLVLISAVLLGIEASRGGRLRWAVFGTGLLSSLLLAAVVARPLRIAMSGQETLPRVLLLLDDSYRMTLPGTGGEERLAVRDAAAEELSTVWKSTRQEILYFGDAEPRMERSLVGSSVHSDLLRTLDRVLATPGESPEVVVVISDGRFETPGPLTMPESRAALQRRLRGVSLHTVGVAAKAPEDRSLRVVSTSGTAIAHQPFLLHVEVGCSAEGLCNEPAVVVRELLEGQAPVELARGIARGKGEQRLLDLEITLDRAGGRMLEVALESGDDEVPHNDRRLLPIQVRRDRTRVLHVAGRPTYDVRALRMFLKADASIDLVAFFILRTHQDAVGASENELALIPFPVDELFSDHLPSFDAIVLQDIDAYAYGVSRHFAEIQDYVMAGGGLIMVGGPAGFSAGGYANSPIESVLPVSLTPRREGTSRKVVVPEYTAAGRAAPMLEGVRRLLGDTLPEMAGSNLVGAAKPGAWVLWQHPQERVVAGPSEVPMPLLALSEVGDGRSISLALDAVHKLRFGKLGARSGGEAHGELWEGLLGWLMRDPRFEAAQARLEQPCLVGGTTHLRVTPMPEVGEDLQVEIAPLSDAADAKSRRLEVAPQAEGGHRFVLNNLPPGGYAARVTVGEAPAVRHVFACEQGGEAHADSRPDPARLRRLAAVAGGEYRDAEDVAELPVPPTSYVAERRVAQPILPAWLWAVLSALGLGAHWLLRRADGLS